MKRYFLRIFVCFAALLLILPALAQAEVIPAMRVETTLLPDRRLSVTETIIYDFGSTEKHGIFRFIPVSYRREDRMYNLRLENFRVTQDGKQIDAKITRQAEALNIRIGDPDITIVGSHVYAISYETNRAINFFNGEGELYWNVTGNGWPVEISNASYKLDISSLKLTSVPRAICFTGVYGSIEAACEVSATQDSVSIASKSKLLPGEGLTVAIRFPVGAIKQPTRAESLWMLLRDNLILGVPLFALVVMLVIWCFKGRDPQMRSIIPHYESPEGRLPAEIAAILREGNTPSSAVTATIIDLARRGYLKIKYDQEKMLFLKLPKYTFVRLRNADDKLKDYERTVFNGLFGAKDEVTLEDLKKRHKFYTSVDSMRRQILKAIQAEQLFDKHPSSQRHWYFVVGFISAAVITWFFSSHPMGWPIGLATGLVIALVGYFMPRPTLKGSNTMADIKGFAWFLGVTEKDRLAFHNAPERTPEEFFALLPFAIALGVEKAWAKQFAGIDMPPPDWYQGAAVSHFSSSTFTRSVSAMSAMASSAYSAPSSAGRGGSGFSGGGSGGGGGGGGGGSW